jgi:hypothetical protein
MSSELNCLIVGISGFPQQKLRESLAPAFCFTTFDTADSVSEAFQCLVNTNFNLCVIAASLDQELQPFFRDMRKLGRDRTCAFVKFSPARIRPKETAAELQASGFCATISADLDAQDLIALRKALSQEMVKIREELKAESIPGCVDLVLRELDQIARRKQRGIDAKFDQVIASLVRDMMSETSIHHSNFLEALSIGAEQSISFSENAVEIPDQVLERNLPKLDKSTYRGTSSRVWNKLLKRYGVQQEKS